MGTLFVANQAYEWTHLSTRWYTNSYGSVFFITTGLHGLHVFLGLVAMALLLFRMRGTEGDHIRRFLTQADDALDGLPVEARAAVKREGVDEAAYRPFLDALDQDVARARAGIALALAQRAIASQLVDNLNASIHLRTLLTDLFLLDEALASHRA